MKKKGEIFLILHNIRSAYNVGSIFRTADAVGVAKIFLCGYTPTPETTMGIFASDAKMPIVVDKISKVALGAEKTVPWEQCKQTWRLLSSFAKASEDKEKVQIVALEQDKRAIDYRKFKPEFTMVLVLGNEVEGLSKEILKYADKIIAIQMYGQKESLNVSVAAGIALYEITK